MMQLTDMKRQQEVVQWRMPNVCGIKLSGYAESFRELAKSFERDKPSQMLDRRGFLEEERLRENCGVIAGHLNELAEIMEQTANEISELEPLEDKLWKKLFSALRGEGILMEGACFWPTAAEGVKYSLRLRTDLKGGIDAGKAEKILSTVLNKRLCLSLNGPGMIEKESRSFLYLEQPQFMAFTGFARVTKGKEEISGDNYSVLQSERGKLTLLLSDGTGSGQKACRDSSWVLDLTEKLLETGYTPEAAIHLVNCAIMAGGDDMGHPTLDMCTIDLQHGNCEFCKAGGTLSFRKRGREVDKIDAGHLPLGIFQELEPRRQGISLREGDCIVMLTDGVSEAFRDKGYEEAVMESISEMDCKNPRELAEKLMQLAIFTSGGNIRDDMTVLTAAIWKNP